MSSLLILQSLLILFTILSQSKRQHKCAHNHVADTIDLRESHVNYKNHPYDKHILNIKNTHKRRLTTTQPSPIRVRPYYDPKYISLEAGLTTEQINYIKSLISTVTRFYSETISVTPVENNLFIHRKCTDSYDTEFGKNCVEYLKPDQCGMIDIPSTHMDQDLLYHYPDNTTATKLPKGTGIPDTDLIIYVSYGQTASCGEATLAWAAPCFQDQYGRPIAGTVNICPFIFEEEQFWKQDVVVLLHEITHIVIMGPELWLHFRDTNGNIISHDSIVSSEQQDGLIYIISPAVAAFAKQHFGCDKLIGFPLENTGSGGSAGSHWDEHYGMSAVMGSTIWGGLQYFTNLTLSIMVDSGWYYINYKLSEPFYWGKNTGCDFFINECVNWETTKSNWPQYFCDNQNDNGCFYNYDAPAECEFYNYNNDLPWYKRYFTDSKFGGPEASDYCPFRDPSTQVNFENACWDERGNTEYKLKYNNEKYGTNSRCVDIENNNGLKEGRCFEHKCFGFDGFTKRWYGVQIFIDPTEHINCTRNEQPNGITMTNKYSNNLGIHIKCPSIDAICGSNSQPFKCYYGNWKDEYNQCICNPGYTGILCDQEDRTIGLEIPINLNEILTKSPTLQPTNPITEICVENFSNLQLNDIYIFDAIWNYYPRYKSPNNGLYLFWNIFTHWWMIYDKFDTLYYYALCNVSEFNNDITKCNGEWKVHNIDFQTTIREPNANTYYGLCKSNVITTDTTTQSPTPKPSTTKPTRYPTTPHPARSYGHNVNKFWTTDFIVTKTVTKTENNGIINHASGELFDIGTTDMNGVWTFMTTDINGMSKLKSTLKKWGEMDWINFFFKGYIGWVFVSVLCLIIVLLICVISSMTNCKICQRDYDYVGIDLHGGCGTHFVKTNMELSAKDDDFDDDIIETDLDNEDEYEQIDDTDGETDDDVNYLSSGGGNVSGGDVQTIITSDLL